MLIIWVVLSYIFFVLAQISTKLLSFSRNRVALILIFLLFRVALNIFFCMFKVVLSLFLLWLSVAEHYSFLCSKYGAKLILSGAQYNSRCCSEWRGALFFLFYRVALFPFFGVALSIFFSIILSGADYSSHCSDIVSLAYSFLLFRVALSLHLRQSILQAADKWLTNIIET